MENLYFRFTTDIDKDLDNGYSIHATGLEENIRPLESNEIIIDGFICEKLNGHCAFSLDDRIEDYDIETLDELIEDLREGFHYNDTYSTDYFGKNWVIVKGEFVDNCPEGEVIIITEVIHKEYE